MSLDGTDDARPGAGRPRLVLETVLVLAVSLGASAVWSALSLVEKLTRHVPLNQQTTTMNSSATPDRPWLDLIYQLTQVALGVAPAALALYLLTASAEPRAGGLRAAGLRPVRPAADAVGGLLIFAAIGVPGVLLYLGARALGLNTDVQPANLAQQWWTVPVYILLAAMNGVLEEVVMIGYLVTRWTQAGWRATYSVAVSALIRGAYHLYQGFGGFVGNLIMGVLFGLWFQRSRRLLPLVIAHTLLDVASFVGYALLAPHVSWLR